MKFAMKLALAVSVSALTFSAPLLTSQAVAAPKKAGAELGTFGFDLTGLDKSIKPGDDFYGWANGEWAKRTTIPADKSNYGMFTALADLSQQRVRDILDTAKADKKSKLGMAYSSFLDEAAVEAKGLTPINPWLNEIRALNGYDGYVALAAKADRMGIDHIFGGGVYQDAKSPTEYIYNMGSSGMGMPDRDMYLDEKNAELRTAYVAHLAKMLTLAGESDVDARAQAIMDFETAVAKVSWTREDDSDATKTYNKMTIAELNALAPGFDFAEYIKAIGLPGAKEVDVAEPSAFTAIAALAAKTDVGVLKDQLLVRSLDSYSDVLPDAITAASFDFYGKTLNGTQENQPRWKRAVDFTEGTLPDEVGKIYVTKFYPKEAQQAMKVLVGNLQNALGKHIDALTWMTPDTKVKARAKLAAFKSRVGFPEKWHDYSSMEIKADDLFGNAMRSRLWKHEWNIGKLGKPIYRWEWGMNATTVNAQANPTLNAITFPAAILQPPFFDPKADPAINYGGIGAVIGHEMSHHFDDQGRKFDANGAMSEWWTKEDIAAFEALTGKLVAQYDAYEIFPGANVKGEFTLGENIGDLAGLAIAYDAYKASLGGKEAPVIDGYTGDQRFFMGWAQVWRRNYREANLRNRLLTDPHSPSQQRTWVVRNIDKWYDAFRPSEGEKLFLKPEDRVRIW